MLEALRDGLTMEQACTRAYISTAAFHRTQRKDTKFVILANNARQEARVAKKLR